MNPDSAPEDLAGRIASIRVNAPADHLDIDTAIQAGTKRRWRRRLAGSAAFVCAVIAIAGSVSIVLHARHDKSLTTANSDDHAAALTAEQLTGRWIAVQIDGRDISSWRDIGGLPANLLIGADRSPHEWQVNRTCGPLIRSTFTIRRDGSFTANPPPRRFQSCPSVPAPAPDLAEAITRSAFVTVSAPGGSTARTLQFLDRKKQLVASWREDTALTSRTSACRKALGARATSDGFTTVERIRAERMSAENQIPDDAFADLPGGSVAIYCRQTGAATSAIAAVTMNGQKVRLRSVN